MKMYMDDKERFSQLHDTVLHHLLESDDQTVISAIEEIHYADLAEIMMELEDNERNRLFTLLTRNQAAAVFSNIDSDVFEDLFALLKHEQKIAILDLMGQDDIVDILGEVSDALKNRIISLLDQEDREDVAELLVYDEDTAGGIMTKDYIDVKRTMTIGDAIGHLRTTAPEAETIYYVYVTDEGDKLAGIVSLRELIVANPAVKVEDVMIESVIHVHVSTDQEEVARIVSKYNLLAVPVIDDNELLVGIVTVDDIIDVLEEEATEDILRIAGIGDEELDHYEDSFFTSVLYSVKARLPWLIVTIFGGMLSAFVISGFSEALAADQTIALFMPLLAGMGGNVGTQSSTLTVRNIAINDIQGSEVGRTLLQEVFVGFMVGLVCSAIVGVMSYLMKGRMMLSLIVGLAMWANILTAATIGTLVPLIFKRIGVDPAVASAPFITTTIDITGLSIYFTLATLMMAHLL
ncbi:MULTISPECIES: magnesium transporter [unclassified Fusibacter]|uniref:magnesium transporter n=1 Tax=unclassified Fusibacter TaxID=2624464 RepID=UPI0010111397|nr:MULTISPECIES: magnesium transporter [unclassified Fusibacter]MCK8058111.1 magnesium transporter [Fusibacter sp. A2]NPE20693.1 magnesium transporter [Fusibacter sp. A1]RXV62899.1 magnesium transporter [Fusibacter sp. A1]